MATTSYKVWVEVVCCECARAANGRFVRTQNVPKRQMMEEARKEGFIFEGGEAYCSAACLKYKGLRNVEVKKG